MVVPGLSASDFLISMRIEENLWQVRQTHAIVEGGLDIRVSQNDQKSKFWYATNPSGFHRLDEPPKKISAL